MSARSILRISGWLAGSVFALLVTNFVLVLFVSGVDIFLGQAPQFTLPLFSLLTVSVVLIAVHRSKSRAVALTTDNFVASATAVRARKRKSAQQLPAYLSMTVIRRPSVHASSSGSGQWRGTVQ